MTDSRPIWNDTVPRVSWRIDMVSRTRTSTEEINTPTAIFELQINSANKSNVLETLSFFLFYSFFFLVLVPWRSRKQNSSIWNEQTTTYNDSSSIKYNSKNDWSCFTKIKKSLFYNHLGFFVFKIVNYFFVGVVNWYKRKLTRKNYWFRWNEPSKFGSKLNSSLSLRKI